MLPRDKYLSGNIGSPFANGYPVTGFINDRLPASARILSFYVLPYYVNRDVLDAISYCPQYGSSMAESLNSDTNKDFLEKLKGLNVSYVAVNLIGPLNVNNKIGELSAGGALQLICFEGGVKLYSVGDKSPKGIIYSNSIDKVVQVYEQSLRVHPGDIATRLQLADIYANRPDFWSRDYDSAFNEYEKVLKLSHDNPQANAGLGDIIWIKEEAFDWGSDPVKKMDVYKASADHFLMALDANPGNLSALTGLLLNHNSTGGFSRELSGRITTARRSKGNGILLYPPLTAACTFLFLDKFSIFLWISLIALILSHVLLRRLVKEKDLLLAETIIWIMIVFVNYFPQLFIPFGKLFISFM